MTTKPVIRLDDPVVGEDGCLTFAKLLAVAEHLRFEFTKEDCIDIQAVPVQEQRRLS